MNAMNRTELVSHPHWIKRQLESNIVDMHKRNLTFIKMKNDTLRVHFNRGRGVRNIDITVSAGSIFDINVHKLHGKTVETVTISSLYHDEFMKTIDELTKI